MSKGVIELYSVSSDNASEWSWHLWLEKDFNEWCDLSEKKKMITFNHLRRKHRPRTKTDYLPDLFEICGFSNITVVR